jgi:HlyD family secretion protein
MLKPVPVSTVAATTGDAIDAAYATAVVEARERVMVRARVAGTVAELFAREGDVVKKGQLLARLEAPGIEADLRRSQGELSASRAEMAAIQAELNNAREEAGRARALAKTEAISTAEVNRVTNGVAVVEARLAAARAKAGAIASDIRSRSTTGAKSEARELEVRAPLDGIVLRRDASVGEVVPARAPLFDVAETHELLVECVVDEADLGRVTGGTRAVVSFRALKPRTFDGKVVEIARDANREKKSFIVKVQLETMPPEVRTGMSAEVNLVLAERHDATLVAPGSVDGSAVWVVRAGRAHKQPVEVGVKSPSAVEIKSGIAPGDAVILNFERVHEGSKVAPAPIAWSWAGGRG